MINRINFKALYQEFLLKKKFKFSILQITAVLFFLLFFSFLSKASQNEKDNKIDDTMLMFIGEDLSFVTLASRKPESPENAPAIVRVVGKAEIEEHGFLTLAELLSNEPGFYMAQKGLGTLPYLRGISDGILFLYDGVPLSSGVAKQLNYLDLELSLEGVKKVEIIRGPGSVLWGSDAFAGIVNIVPMTGKDINSSYVNTFIGSDNLLGGNGSFGYSGKKWDFFIRGYAAKNRWQNDSYLLEILEDGETTAGCINDSHYGEIIYNAKLDNWLSVSGRVSDFIKRFTMHEPGPLSWEGKRRSPSWFTKVNVSKPIGLSNISVTGYVNSISNDITKVNLEQKQEDRSVYGEILWDRQFFKTGFLTAGISFKNSWIDGAVLAEDFLPDYLKPTHEILIPTVSQKDYTESLSSFFVQYRDRWHNIEWWAGGRIDDHSRYAIKVSYNFGLNISFAQDWRIKAAYGTAYRTPYSGQLFGEKAFEPEGIYTLNLQLAWKPDLKRTVALTAFYNRLTDYVQNDPYGGLSAPFGHDILGLELMGRFNLTDFFNIFATASIMNSMGDSPEYTLVYTYYGPDGQIRKEYEIWEEPFDTAPNFMINAGFTWKFKGKKQVTVDYAITDSIDYSFTKNTVTGNFDAPAMLGITFRADDFLIKKFSLTLGVRNLLNQKYTVPGMYGPEKGRPLTIFGLCNYKF